MNEPGPELELGAWGAVVVEVPAWVRGRIVAEARRAAPGEACGLALTIGDAASGVWTRVAVFAPLDNMAAEPERSFELRLSDLAVLAVLRHRGVGWALVHSHVAGAALPSSADLRHGAEGSVHLIYDVERDELRAFRYDRHRDDRLRERLRAVELSVVTLPNPE